MEENTKNGVSTSKSSHLSTKAKCWNKMTNCVTLCKKFFQSCLWSYSSITIHFNSHLHPEFLEGFSPLFSAMPLTVEMSQGLGRTWESSRVQSKLVCKHRIELSRVTELVAWFKIQIPSLTRCINLGKWLPSLRYSLPTCESRMGCSFRRSGVD